MIASSPRPQLTLEQTRDQHPGHQVSSSSSIMDPGFHEADIMHGIQQVPQELMGVLLSLGAEVPIQQA
jgi:hypothetical protein